MAFGGEDYTDYTLLKKKGLLKIKEDDKIPLKSEGGFIDFTSFGSKPEENKTPEQTGPAPNFGFLDAPVQAETNSGNVNPLSSFETYTSSTSSPLTQTSSQDFNALRLKVDDLDYKIDRFIEKMDKIEEKLNSIKLG